MTAREKSSRLTTLTQEFRASFLRGEKPVSFAALTPSEQYVWRGVAEGLSSKLMAAGRGWKEKTATHWRWTLYAKIGAANGAEAVRLAVQHGVVPVIFRQ